MGKRSRFTNEYKKEMVRLVTELGKTPAEVAADIGVTAKTVRLWVKALETHGNAAFPGKGKLHPCDEEVRAKDKLIKELKEENAILKKAMTIFAKDGK